MRVAVFARSFMAESECGGVATALVHAMRAGGHDAVVVCARGEAGAWDDEESGVTVRTVWLWQRALGRARNNRSTRASRWRITAEMFAISAAGAGLRGVDVFVGVGANPCGLAAAVMAEKQGAGALVFWTPDDALSMAELGTNAAEAHRKLLGDCLQGRSLLVCAGEHEADGLRAAAQQAGVGSFAELQKRIVAAPLPTVAAWSLDSLVGDATMSSEAVDARHVLVEGALTPRLGADVVLAAMKLLKTRAPGLRCLVRGDGAFLGPLVGLAKALDVEDVVEFNARPATVAERAGALVLARPDRQDSRTGTAMLTTDEAVAGAMLSGVPVICGAGGDTARWLAASVVTAPKAAAESAGTGLSAGAQEELRNATQRAWQLAAEGHGVLAADAMNPYFVAEAVAALWESRDLWSRISQAALRGSEVLFGCDAQRKVFDDLLRRLR